MGDWHRVRGEGGIVTVVIHDVMLAPWGGMPSLENFAKDSLIVFGAPEALMLIIECSILSAAFSFLYSRYFLP